MQERLRFSGMLVVAVALLMLAGCGVNGSEQGAAQETPEQEPEPRGTMSDEEFRQLVDGLGVGLEDETLRKAKNLEYEIIEDEPYEVLEGLEQELPPGTKAREFSVVTYHTTGYEPARVAAAAVHRDHPEYDMIYVSEYDSVEDVGDSDHGQFFTTIRSWEAFKDMAPPEAIKDAEDLRAYEDQHENGQSVDEQSNSETETSQTDGEPEINSTGRVSFEAAAEFFASEEQQKLHETAVNVARDMLLDIEANENIALADTSELQEDMEYTEWYLADEESQVGVIYGKFFGMDYESLSVFFVDSEKDMTKNIMLTNLGDPENVPDVQGPEDIPEIIEYISKPESNLLVEWVSWEKTSNPDEYSSLSSDDLENGEMDSREAIEAIERLEEEMTS